MYECRSYMLIWHWVYVCSCPRPPDCPAIHMTLREWHVNVRVLRTWLADIHMCQDVFVWAVTFSYVLWLFHMCHDASSCVTSLIHMRTWLADIHAHPHSYAPWLIHTCHDSIVCAMTPLIHMRTWLVDIHIHPHSSAPWLLHIWHNTFTRETPFVRMRTWLVDIHVHPHSSAPRLFHMCHDWFVCAMAPKIYMCTDPIISVDICTLICAMTLSYMQYLICTCDTTRTCATTLVHNDCLHVWTWLIDVLVHTHSRGGYRMANMNRTP